MASPLKRIHGKYHSGRCLMPIKPPPPGVDAGDNITVVLSDYDEAQPDLVLRLPPECGGQSQDTADGYVSGAPELIAEIAYSSWAIDLHTKRETHSRKLNQFVKPLGKSAHERYCRSRVVQSNVFLDVPEVVKRCRRYNQIHC